MTNPPNPIDFSTDENGEIFYSRHDIARACEEIEKLRDAQKSTTKAYDYYNTIHQTLSTLDCVFHSMQSYKRMVNILAHRLDILEKFILATDKK